MAKNRFFTIMIVPEKSDQVTRLVIPGYLFKGGVLALVFLAVLAGIMVLDYANVMNQINENKLLKVENRQLKQSVQVFKNKILTMENTLDRVKTFVTKLRIITNIESSPSSNPSPTPPGEETPANQPIQGSTTSQNSPTPPKALPAAPPEDEEGVRARRGTLMASLMRESDEGFTMSDAEGSRFVKTEFEKLDSAYSEVQRFALATEQETQLLLEQLGDKRAQFVGMPTRIPTLGGYITSEYGVRLSPYDNRRKLHEGIDIANRFGADIIAPADGVVSFAGVKPGYGRVVILDHRNGIETLYAHGSRLYVNAGAIVHRGQRLAAVGNTGHSTGPHVHYEIRVSGLTVDPCGYILDSACVGRTTRMISRGRPPEGVEPGLVDPD